MFKLSILFTLQKGGVGTWILAAVCSAVTWVGQWGVFTGAVVSGSILNPISPSLTPQKSSKARPRTDSLMYPFPGLWLPVSPDGLAGCSPAPEASPSRAQGWRVAPRAALKGRRVRAVAFPGTDVNQDGSLLAGLGAKLNLT